MQGSYIHEPIGQQIIHKEIRVSLAPRNKGGMVLRVYSMCLRKQLNHGTRELGNLVYQQEFLVCGPAVQPGPIDQQLSPYLCDKVTLGTQAIKYALTVLRYMGRIPCMQGIYTSEQIFQQLFHKGIEVPLLPRNRRAMVLQVHSTRSGKKLQHGTQKFGNVWHQQELIVCGSAVQPRPIGQLLPP